MDFLLVLGPLLLVSEAEVTVSLRTVERVLQTIMSPDNTGLVINYC